MLTFEEAKKIGIKACVDKLGYDLVKKYESTACSAYGDEGDHASCFVGISTEPDRPWIGGPLLLDDSPDSKFTYSANCNVAYSDGTVTFFECVLPQTEGSLRNEPQEPTFPLSVSKKTLKAMDAAVDNLKSGIVSKIINLNEFDN